MERAGEFLLQVTVLLLLLACHASGCDEHELDALMELKSAINFPNGTALAGWSKEDEMGWPAECCSWIEVECGLTGRVTFLDLYGVRQTDWYVNASVFLPFSELQTLDLSGNHVTGWTPHLQQLSSLQELYLNSNNLGRMVDLYGLLCQLKNIPGLSIRDNGIQGQFPVCLRNFTSLASLDISENNLYGILPSFLANMSTLQSLDLSSNQFHGNVIDSPLIKLTSLQELKISNNKFQIPRTLRSFFNQSSLETLWLDSNDFIADNAIQQSLFVPKFQLSSMSMTNCKVVAPLPHFFLSQYSLIYLDLSHNYIEGSFPDWLLENNTDLAFLNIANNLLRGKLHLWRHYELKVLDVSINQVSDLPTNLSQLIPNIVFFNVSRNSIQIITPSTFGGMKNLSLLDLSSNHLDGEIPPNCFEGCLSLETLYFSDNNLRATPSLSDSTFLRVLRLSNNNLSLIPSSLSPSSLKLLDMSNNNLRGQIPANFCKFNSLNFLDLSNNKFSGFLPPCFNASSLAFVFLNNNKLNGSQLSVFKNSSSLAILDLGNNCLSGMVPEWIGDLRSLSSLILRKNNFEGEIPSQICSLGQLAILDLSGNTISGQIPHCLSLLTFQPLSEKSFLLENPLMFQNTNSAIRSLTSEYIYAFAYFFQIFFMETQLDITLKSHTYTYIGIDLDDMSALDLSCNNLSGEIPPEIGSIVGVHGVNLSHNKLEGRIPSTLSNLSNIESLDLSYNHLCGSIPFELARLNYLGVFSVAYNNLSGIIPENAQFGTFDESSYVGNPCLCGPPLLKDCFASIPRDQVVEDVDGSFDIYVFYICFVVSSAIMFVTTLIILYVNSYWRRVWFYFAEMWIICVCYFIVDSTKKAMKTSIGVILRFIHYLACYVQV